jgi:hypothetical protein
LNDRRALDDVAAKAWGFRDWLRGFVTRHLGKPITPATTKALAPLNDLLAGDTSYPVVAAGEPGLRVSRVRRWENPDELLHPIAEGVADLICNADFRLTYRRDEPALRPVHRPEARRHQAADLGAEEATEDGPAVGAAQRRRASAGPRGGAGFLVGRSILTNAAAHANPKLVLKMDIKEFFPTVTWRRVKGVFRRAGYRARIATLLALLCTEAPREIVQVEGKTYYVSLGPRCLPQGAPTSPAITNALCLRLDRRLAGLAAKHGWRYTRYADDMTFSLPADHKDKPKLKTMLGSVRAIVEAEGFALNPEKTRVHRTGGRQSVTGLVVNGDAPPRAPRKLRRELRAAVHNLRAGKPLKEGESVARLGGYAAYVYMTDPKLGMKMLGDLLGLAPA